MFSHISSLSSLPSLSSSLRPPSPSRSHALCPHFFLFLLLISSQSTTASPYYEREWNGAAEDDVPVFETDGATIGPYARSSDPPSLSLSRSSSSSRIETTTNRPIRPETITAQPTVPSPQIVSAIQPTPPLPTVLTTQQSTVIPETETTISIELQNTRMMEIVANLTKKLQGAGSGNEISISFTPDELKKMQEIIGDTDQKMKANFEITRRQLMIPNGAGKIPDVYNYDDNTKQLRPENPRYHEEEMEITSTILAPERNITVIDEATIPPTESIPDDLVLPEVETPEDSQTIEEELSESTSTVVIDQFQPIRPALCKLNTDDEVISILWMFLQSRIREWGYDEEQSTVLVLATFGLLVDSEHTLIEAEEPGFIEDVKAAIQCLFRDCRLAMPNKRVPERVVVMPSSPKKRETVEFHSALFECQCPNGYVFA